MELYHCLWLYKDFAYFMESFISPLSPLRSFMVFAFTWTWPSIHNYMNAKQKKNITLKSQVLPIERETHQWILDVSLISRIHENNVEIYEKQDDKNIPFNTSKGWRYLNLLPILALNRMSYKTWSCWAFDTSIIIQSCIVDDSSWRLSTTAEVHC